MFKRPFSFKGRIRRREYGITWIIVYAYAITNGLIMEHTEWAYRTIGFVCMLPCWWFLFAQGAKRCHDINRSGWIQCTFLFPIIFFFYPLISLLFTNSDYGENFFGKNPKGIGNHDEEDKEEENKS